MGSMAHGTEHWMGQRRSTFSIAAELIEQNLLHPEKLLTHRFALTNFKEAFHAMKRKGQTRAIKVVFDYALLPASVVPNVRTSARQRRPARVTTAAWPDREEQQVDDERAGAGVEANALNQPAGGWMQPEVENEPSGPTWVQQVQPYPQVVIQEAVEEVEPAPAVTEENAPASVPYPDDWVMQGETFEQKPMDDTMLFYTYEDQGEQAEPSGEEMPEWVAVLGTMSEPEAAQPQPFPPDTAESEPVEAQPASPDTQEEEAQEQQPASLDGVQQTAATPESEAETATVKIQRSGLAGRKRARPDKSSAEGQANATKEAPETL